MAGLTKVQVEKADGSKVTYPVLPKTIVAFERKFSMSLGDLSTMEHTYWLAWDAESTALKSKGSVTKLFDDWLEDLVDVVVEGDAVPLAGQPPSQTA